LNDPCWENKAEKLSFVDMNKDDFIDEYKDKEYPVKIMVISWYDWNRQNWGTKWNAGDPNIVKVYDDMLYFSFETAWTPPMGIYEELIRKYENNEKYGDIQIEYYYYEPGVGFVGSRYEEYDLTNANLYITKVLEYRFEDNAEECGFLYDEENDVYREMTEEDYLL